MSEHHVPWESWQAVLKERDRYREALQSIIHAHQVGATCCRLDEIAQAALGEKPE